jgi:hypothetical protein
VGPRALDCSILSRALEGGARQTNVLREEAKAEAADRPTSVIPGGTDAFTRDLPILEGRRRE